MKEQRRKAEERGAAEVEHRSEPEREGSNRNRNEGGSKKERNAEIPKGQ